MEQCIGCGDEYEQSRIVQSYYCEECRTDWIEKQRKENDYEISK